MRALSLLLLLLAAVACRRDAPAAVPDKPISPQACYDACQEQLKRNDVTHEQADLTCRDRCGLTPQPTEPAWDEDAEYERLYTQCTAGCAEADRTTPSPQDPEKTICAFICDYSATSAVELKSCQLRCQHDHGDNKDTAPYRQCLNACNPDHVEDDPTDSPR